MHTHTTPITGWSGGGKREYYGRSNLSGEGKRASFPQPCVLLLFGAHRKEGIRYIYKFIIVKH